MSSPTEAGPSAGGSGRWVKVALVLSLVLNVCFLAGPFVWHAFEPPPGQRFQHRVVHQLELNDAQRRAFQDFVRTARQARRALRDANDPLGDQVWTEQAKATPDQTRIAELIGQADQNREKFERAITTALGSFLAALSPEQRAKFGEIVRDRRDRAAEHLSHTLIP
jgi:Spy/CpxP family protein refolding chaperone